MSSEVHTNWRLQSDCSWLQNVCALQQWWNFGENRVTIWRRRSYFSFFFMLLEKSVINSGKRKLSFIVQNSCACFVPKHFWAYFWHQFSWSELQITGEGKYNTCQIIFSFLILTTLQKFWISRVTEIFCKVNDYLKIPFKIK